MPAERISMRKIRDVLRLFHENKLSKRKTADSVNIHPRSVDRYLKKAKALGIIWPLPADMDDDKLEQLLFPQNCSATKKQESESEPNWNDVYKELKKKGVTRFLLWEEFSEEHPGIISYSQFCRTYKQFVSVLNPSMRQTHKAGEKLFIDYSGLTVPYVDRLTGEVYKAEIFVAVFGASDYTFAEATASQSLPNWISSHVKAFCFFGGVSEILIPDNLKSGVTKANKYDPDINPTYQDMANHYGVAIVPARVRAPKDKAKAENGVLGIERRILAKLRKNTFFSVAEINMAIKPLLEEYNNRKFQQLSETRKSLFLKIDKPTLRSLPAMQYEYAEWKKARAGIDYHVAFEKHYYSVPYKFIKKQLDLRITKNMVECFYKGKSIASHKRSYVRGYTTLKEHMPKSHQEQAEWTPERLIRWAKKAGNKTEELIYSMIESRPHPQQAFRACLGIMRLGKSYGDDRLENASNRALTIGSLSYKSVESILKHGLDRKPMPVDSVSTSVISHANIRGANYYN